MAEFITGSICVSDIPKSAIKKADNGKLYINYPMIESIRYTKELPDDAYVGGSVGRSDRCEPQERLQLHPRRAPHHAPPA